MIVRYADTLIPHPFTGDAYSNTNRIAMYNLFCTKAKCWEYEQEVRIMAWGQCGPHPFDSNTLCELYFGVNADKQEIKNVLKLAKDNGYTFEKICQMQISKQGFNLNEKPINTYLQQV